MTFPGLLGMIMRPFSLIKVTHIPGTGHHVRFEDYGSYMQTVRSFLAEIEG